MGISWSFGFNQRTLVKDPCTMGKKVPSFCTDHGRCSSGILDFGLAIFPSEPDADPIDSDFTNQLPLL